MAVWQEITTPGRFEGQTVIVTGAASGIGLATALRVAREGGRVIASDLSEEGLEKLVAEHGDLGFVPVAGDISQEDTVQRVVAATGGQIDPLANVAGIMDSFQPVHELDDATWERVLDVNLTSMMRLMRAVVPTMLASRYGSIVNVSSEAGLRGSAAGAAYTAPPVAEAGELAAAITFLLSRDGSNINGVVLASDNGWNAI
ncbi:SDR family NAD(P)-dependent oxidoreductase [Pseudarthrobacter siccitolerans]